MDNGIESDEEESFLNLDPSGNGNGKMIPLELEIEEQDPTLPAAGRAPGLRMRKNPLDNFGQGGASFIKGFVQGVLRQNIGSQFTYRNMVVLSSIAGALLLVVVVLNYGVEHEFDGVRTAAPHTNSFGGVNNPGIENGNTGQFRRPPMITEEDLPKSNVGHAVPSLSQLNLENHPAHFRHDPLHSPYASKLYAANVESEQVRQEIQARFDARRQQYRDRYGYWTDPPFTGDKKQLIYNNYAYKDVPAEMFPNGSWQSDSQYMKKFLYQARSLVNRVKEAIYEEYGYGMVDVDKDDPEAVAQVKAKQKAYFSVRVGDYKVDQDGAALVDGVPFVGAAYVNKHGWEGIVRKLIHAIMTEDEFYVVAGGHPLAYEGINFQLTQIMQFHDIMEPVFDRLGITLISRNMAMDASTTVSALGGADIYGEADIFWYITDPENRVETDQQLDLLYKQMIMSGERMPLILAPNLTSLSEATKGTTWLGNTQPGPMSCAETDVSTLPDVKACQYAFCTKQAKMKDKCQGDKSLPCWIDRQMTSLTSDDELQQRDAMAPSSWNYRQHQLEGRKLTLLVLEALAEALSRMTISTETSQARIMPTQSWHVGDIYEELRDEVRRVKKLPDSLTEDAPACEKLLESLDSDICHMEMHAFTEYTPRVTPDKSGLSTIAGVGGFVNETADAVQLYGWFDLLPLEFAPGDDEVDLHMVAIQGGPGGGRFLNRSRAEQGSDTQNAERLTRMLADNTNGTDTGINLWRLHGTPSGFCDGSSMSWCNKVLGNDCLLGNKNHYKGGMLSQGSSDWLVLDIGEVKEGVVLLRFEWSADYGKNMALPSDLIFHHSIKGPDVEVVKLSGHDFLDKNVKLADDLMVFPVMVNKAWSKDVKLFGDVTLALKFETSDSSFPMLLTHVYYA